jgi:hypothetical protein
MDEDFGGSDLVKLKISLVCYGLGKFHSIPTDLLY